MVMLFWLMTEGMGIKVPLVFLAIAFATERELPVPEKE
jgi:hypothetical protein